MPDVVLVRKCYPNYRRVNQHRNWKLKKLDMVGMEMVSHLQEQEESNRKVNLKKEEQEYEQFLMDLEEDADMRHEVNIYKDKTAAAPILSGDVEPDAPVIPLEEMLEEMNLDEEVQGDDMVLEGTSDEENGRL